MRQSHSAGGVSSHRTCHDGHISTEQPWRKDPIITTDLHFYSQFPPPLRQQSEMFKFIIYLMVEMKAFHTETPVK